MFQFSKKHMAYNRTVQAVRSLDDEAYFEKIWSTLAEKINVT
jgi:hypothetical protein